MTLVRLSIGTYSEYSFVSCQGIQFVFLSSSGMKQQDRASGGIEVCSHFPTLLSKPLRGNTKETDSDTLISEVGNRFAKVERKRWLLLFQIGIMSGPWKSLQEWFIENVSSLKMRIKDRKKERQPSFSTTTKRKNEKRGKTVLPFYNFCAPCTGLGPK